MFVLDFPVIQCSVDLLSLTTDVLAALVSGLRRVETLVDVFDWLDGVTPQPTAEILGLYEMKNRSLVPLRRETGP